MSSGSEADFVPQFAVLKFGLSRGCSPVVWHCELQKVHRIHGIVWVGKDIKEHLVSTHCHGQGHLAVAQIAPKNLIIELNFNSKGKF